MNTNTNTKTKTKTNTQIRAIWNGIEVRRHNGQCAHGPWLTTADHSVPNWVVREAMDSMVEDRVDAGQVERGGSIWKWRHGTNGVYVVDGLGWSSECGDVWIGHESYEELFATCSILLSGGPRDGEVVS